MPSPFSRERWQQLSALLDVGWDLPASDRDAWLDALRARDPGAAAEVASLLAEHAALEQEGFLAQPLPVLGAPSLAGQEIGAYTLRSEIGFGGAGSVWLAERTDGRFSGSVAVKLLSASHLGRHGQARFQREGSILARLRHAHIAQLLDAGISAAGQPYLVLEHVEGCRIDEYCDQQALDIEARVRLFLDVLGAVAYAHAHLIVHRDIKPSNVLVAAGGVVKLLDFGIAKLLEPDSVAADPATALTREGEALLTPEYAAPEQLMGAAITTRTDVYGLGVLLYILLSGRHPAGDRPATPAELVRAVLEDEPVRLSALAAQTLRVTATRTVDLAARRGLTPHRLHAALRGDLDNIVGKALKKDPALRYESVDALADDLRRYLRQEPVRARPDSLRYRAGKFVRRHRAAVGLGALAALALSAGLAGTVTQARRANRQAVLAEAQRVRADRQAASALAQRDFALREVARAEAVNDLNTFLLMDAAPAGRRFDARDLLERAERIVRRQHGESDGSKADLLIQVGELHKLREDVTHAERLLVDAYALARTAADPATRGRSACALADVYRLKSDFEAAQRLLKEGLATLPDEPQFTTYRVVCLISASQLALTIDAGADAIARAEEAQRLVRAMRPPAVLLDLDVSEQLAEAYRNQSRLREAALAHERAFALLDALGRTDTDRAATVLNNWGLVQAAAGQHLEAEQRLRQAIGIGSASGAPDSVSPTVLTNLARVLRELDRLPEALLLAARAQRLARSAGASRGVRRALMVRASVYRLMGRPRSATRLLDELEVLLRREVVPTDMSFAILASERAALALLRGDPDAATGASERAVRLAESSGQAAEYLPLVLVRCADVDIAARRPEHALADSRRALTLWQATTDPAAFSSWLGRAYLAQARALHALGRAAEARTTAQQALAHLAPTLGAEHRTTRAARRLASAR